jgi:hypothetical protein
MKYSNTKFKVNSSEESTLVQNALFAEGYKWASGSKKPMYLNSKYLFIDNNGRILHSGGDDDYFNKDGSKEISVNNILNLDYEIY